MVTRPKGEDVLVRLDGFQDHGQGPGAHVRGYQMHGAHLVHSMVLVDYHLK